MRTFGFAVSVIFAGLLAISPAHAADVDNESKCDLYANFGSNLVDFMLPLTMQQFVDLMTGKDTDLEKTMTDQLMGGLTSQNVKTLSTLSESDNELLGEAAGEVAMKMLITGKANSSSKIFKKMRSRCLKIGADQIIANQKRANKANAANFGR